MDKIAPKKESLTCGLIATLISSAICLLVWVLCVRLSGLKIGWMAIPSGIAIGYSMRIFGKGNSVRFGYFAGCCALFLWLLGNYCTAAIIFSNLKGITILSLILKTNFSMIIILLKAIIGPIDFLTGSLSIAIAYYIGLKGITEDRLK